jgi:hypothetical protein
MCPETKGSKSPNKFWHSRSCLERSSCFLIIRNRSSARDLLITWNMECSMCLWMSRSVVPVLIIYIFIFSRKAGGYTHFMPKFWHCLQTGASPLHFVFRVRHDAHARGTRLWCLKGVAVRCRGIAILELGGIMLIDDPDIVWVLEDEDVLLAPGTWETLAVGKSSFCPVTPVDTCGGISGIKIWY